MTLPAENSPSNASDVDDAMPQLSFPLAFGALVLGALAMGISPVFVRFADVGPFASAFWRVALALPVLFLWMVWECRRTGIPLKKALRWDGAVWLSGLFFAGDLFFWHLAILETTIANATFLACLAPIWVALLSGAFIGEPVTQRIVFGLFLCLAGAALLIGGSYQLAPERFMGDVYGFITSIFFGLYFLAVRVARRTHGAGALVFMSTTITAACLLVVTLLAGQGLWPQTITGLLAVLALGLLAHTGGQGLLAVALGSLSATFSSLVIFIEAVAAALFAWLIVNESLSGIQIIGGALILFGIWMARPQKDQQ
ncbi:DMT family transporter [Pseudahrensia aquimaris]|uniref:DMT family transporter n=1 Tax=Pseudahrensia aquimaris TaxID=744461 RepID=A0ABW3FFA7_9HYPH